MTTDRARGLKAFGPLAQWIRALFGRPAIYFEAGERGPELCVKNTRSEAIIIDRLDSKPPLLGFAIGYEVHELDQTILHGTRISKLSAATALTAGKEIRFRVMTFESFEQARAYEQIDVHVYWRTAKRQFLFSKGRSRCRIAVRHCIDLQHQTEDSQRLRQALRPPWDRHLIDDAKIAVAGAGHRAL